MGPGNPEMSWGNWGWGTRYIDVGDRRDVPAANVAGKIGRSHKDSEYTEVGSRHSERGTGELPQMLTHVVDMNSDASSALDVPSAEAGEDGQTAWKYVEDRLEGFQPVARASKP